MALRLHCDIINADSRQVYREITLGTAKPSLEQLNLVNHHFVNHVSIFEEYNVGKYELEVNSFLKDYFQTNQSIILCGGTGLYIDAVLFGIDPYPVIPPEIRIEVNLAYESKGIGFLQEELKKYDPQYYSEVDLNNPRRLTRALEVIYTSGKPFTWFRNSNQKNHPYEIKGHVILPNREELYRRINLRVDQMIHNGLEDEASKFYEYRHLNALQTVGYQEWFDYFDGTIDKSKAIDLIKQNTRNYAKRQITWMKRYNQFTIISK
jgi:tRNA dimethylallyltransferase